jgi:ComF family protein
MVKLLQQWLRQAGQACCGCEVWCFDSSGICDLCRAWLPIIEFGCPTCGLPLPGRWARCSVCERRDPVMRYVVVPLCYAGLGRDLILALKFNNELWAARTLAALMLQQDIEKIKKSVLVPIPSVARRRRHRGFNPAYEIARCVAAETGWPMASSVLFRSGYQPPQSSIADHLARERNVRSAFSVNGSATMPTQVCLVDDVMTTGATLRAAAQACLEGGATTVFAWAPTRAT